MSAAQEELQQIRRMVKTGLTDDGTLHTLRELIEMRISRIRALVKEKPSALNEVGTIRLITLEAEFLYQSGKFRQAAMKLEPLWQELKPRIIGWKNPQCRLEPTLHWKLRREKIWALMHYFFYDLYSVKGLNKEAVEHFTKLEKIIRVELKTETYHPAGTLAMFHYFIGHCYRASRNIPKAQWHFLEAQKEAQRRVEKFVTESNSSRGYEIEYHTVFSARVLGGLSWVAMQEGQLLRAEQLLRTAQAALWNTRQESLKLFIKSILFTAMRRRIAFDTDQYHQAMDGLEDCFKQFKIEQDVSGQLRCASELTRGHLDLAQFRTINPKRDLDLAHEWLRTFETILASEGESPGLRNAVRVRLLSARELFLRGNLSAAITMVDEAQMFGRNRQIADECGIEIEHMTAIVKLHSSPQDAEKRLKSCLSRFKPEKTGGGYYDPVLQAECLVLLASGWPKIIDLASVERYLAQFDTLSQFVENHYLHLMADKIRASLRVKPFKIDPFFDVETRTVDDYVDDCIRWLNKRMRERYPMHSNAKLAKFYGKVGSTLLRRLKKGGRPKTKPLDPNGNA